MLGKPILLSAIATTQDGMARRSSGGQSIEVGPTTNITVDFTNRFKTAASHQFRNQQQIHYNTQHLENAVSKAYNHAGRPPPKKRSGSKKRNAHALDTEIMTGGHDVVSPLPVGSAAGAG